MALRDGAVLAPRLARTSDGHPLVPPEGQPAWRLDIERKGALENLSLVPNPDAARPLEQGEVRVEVRAAGLNFRDVLIALGVYPEQATIGAEGAGIVLEVGAGVTDLSPGDHVMGLMAGAFGPVAVTDQRMVVEMPGKWSFAEAASVPIVFLTAYYALVDLAEINSDQTLLIHAAAGGVGMAAVQLARHLGAEVFATASPSKRAALYELGLDDDHIASSRDVKFKHQFLRVTDGQGVDVVLNSLVREFVDASLELLPRGGRFLEMGKADVREAADISEQYRGVRYRAFDLLDEVEPSRIKEMLVAIVALFEQGALRHAPITTRDVRQGVEAFRILRDAKHVGKIVLTVPPTLDPHGTILITGGTGALGAL
ncbi:MAG: MDR/SDR family oxidoreductase, partial [Dehalococcoidia bacterium]